MNYTPDYFIEKFEKIPDEQWCEGEFTDEFGHHCVLGHVGSEEIDITNGKYPCEFHTDEGQALMRLFNSILIGTVTRINDERSPMFQQATPKQRIIAALRYIKDTSARPNSKT